MATERSVGGAGRPAEADPRDRAHADGAAPSPEDADQQGGDSAPLGPPAEIQSDRIGPSDPDRRSRS